MPNEEYPLTTFNFLVELNLQDPGALGLANPLCQAEFAEVDGLEISIEPKTYREGGNNSQVIQLVGRMQYGNLTLKRGMTSSLDLWKWFSAASAGPKRGARATATILLRDAAHRDRVRFALTGCLPVKLKAPAFNARESTIAIEEMELVYETMTVS